MISVVIPVYNVENCLKECVYSVINQSFSSVKGSPRDQCLVM